MNSLKTTVRRLLCGSTASGANAAMALGVMLAICPTSAFPETQVRGSPEAVRIEAKNASIEEILTALRNSFGLQYRSTDKLEKKITGSYAGSLDRVLIRLLAGNDFVLKTVDGRIEISVLTPRHATITAAAATLISNNMDAAPTPPASPAVTAAKTRNSGAPKPAAPLAAPPSLVTNNVDALAAIPGPFSVADGFASVPSATKGSAVPMPESTSSAVPPPTGSSASSQAPAANPTAIAPPAPVPAKSDKKS